MLNPRQIFFVFLLTISISGCLGSAHYMDPPKGSVASGSGPEPVNPDHYIVSANNYPTYQVKNELGPPKAEACMLGGCIKIRHTKILPSDMWYVTHKVENRYVIQSESYNERQCRYLDRNNSYGGWVNLFGKCLRPHDFAIYISPDGVVSGGWELLPGPLKVGKERYMYLNYSNEKNKGWSKGVIFQQTH